MRERRDRIWMLSFAVLLFACSLGYSQLRMTVSYVPAQTLSPSDIDFEHFESHNLLFTVSIVNTSIFTYSAKLTGTIEIQLADGSYEGRAATFITRAFNVPPSGITFTNLNIGRNGTIQTEEFSFDQNAKNRLNDVALSTGKFPAGTYTFHLDLQDVNLLQRFDSTDVKFYLQNVSRVELRSPQDGSTTNEFPFFEFFQDGEKAVLTVAEKTDNQSREDAISHKPPMLEVELTGQNSFVYSGGRPLEEGKTYVWNVVSTSTSSGGTVLGVPSPIWTFTVSSSPTNLQGSALFDQLLLLFPKYKGLLEQLQKDGFVDIGNTTLNNTALSEIELMNLLNQLRDNDTVVLTVE